MKAKVLRVLLIMSLLALTLMGCESSSSTESQALVKLAKADLLRQLGGTADQIAVQAVEAVDFPDASLGIPEPGKTYAQVLTPGYVIKLVAEGQVYEYHGSGDRVVLAPNSSRSSGADPAAVAQSFYSWFLEYGQTQGNPLVNKAYRSSDLLDEQFVQQVDRLLDSFVGGGYDPFLCAQDFPATLEVGEAMVSGAEASVIVHETWNPGTQYELVREVTVKLREVEGQWRIVDVLCPETQSIGMRP